MYIEQKTRKKITQTVILVCVILAVLSFLNKVYPKSSKNIYLISYLYSQKENDLKINYSYIEMTDITKEELKTNLGNISTQINANKIVPLGIIKLK